MIVKIPNPVLTSPAKEVRQIDKKILSVVDTMKKTLVNADKPKGVGLAAPQIGVDLKIFITRPTQKSKIEVFLNPEIIYKSTDLAEISRIENEKGSPHHDRKLEGCLSIPNVWGYLKRPSRVILRYLALDGKIKEQEFSGFLSTIVQHETDHINGILFTQRVLEQKQKLYKIELNQDGEEKLVEINI